jgi:hypothetical protein
MNAVDHPAHYRKDTGHEAIDVIDAWQLNFNLGNVVKYISRNGIKDPDAFIEDLEKARWYLDREIGVRRGALAHAKDNFSSKKADERNT